MLQLFVFPLLALADPRFEPPPVGICVRVERSDETCDDRTGEHPVSFAYELRDRYVSLDWHRCEGHALRRTFRFEDESCGLIRLHWERKDLAQLVDGKQCWAYYKCEAK